MKCVDIQEEINPSIRENLSSLVNDVFNLIKRLPEGSTTLEEFNNQKVDFNSDVSLGVIPHDNLASFLKLYQEDYRVNTIKKLLHDNVEKVQFRNFYYDPPKTMMSWHTNSNATGTRIYYSLVFGGDIFRYRDPENGKIIDVHGKDGWNIKKFRIGKTDSDRLWHTIYAAGPRISFGFNILP